jgi:hypothetical protein
MNRRIQIFFLALIFMQSLITQSQTLTEHQVRAAYLYNFVKFVEWPDGTFKDESEAILIGLFKDDPVKEELESIIKGRTIDSRPIRIKLLGNSKDADECHVVYLADAERRHQISTINMLGSKPVLTISDADYFCRIGGMIRFFVHENRFRLEINRTAVDRAQLEISAKILRVAEIIDR